MPNKFDWRNFTNSALDATFSKNRYAGPSLFLHYQQVQNTKLLRLLKLWESALLTMDDAMSILPDSLLEYDLDLDLYGLGIPTFTEDEVEEDLGEKGLSLGEKFENGFLGKNFEAINLSLDTVGNITNALPGARNTYNGPKGHIRAGIDQGYNAVADAVANFGPYGKMASMGMKAVNALNGITGSIFGTTNGMTTTDAILDSPLGILAGGLGIINQAFGKKSDTITKNEDVFAQVGSSYGGSNAAVDNALDYSGKKYGAFSSGARQDANALIAEARRLLNMLEDVSRQALNRMDMASYMSAMAGNRRLLAMQGGYNQASIHVGKNGLSFKTILDSKRIVDKFNLKKLSNTPVYILESHLEELSQAFKEGGVLLECLLENIPEDYFEKVIVSELTSIPEDLLEGDTSLKVFKEGGTLEESPENKQEAYIQYALERFPILANLERINLLYDPNFNPKSIGDYGDIEYMEAKYDDLSYYDHYPKDEKYKGKSVIVYNDKVNEEDIALDWLSHGLREHDSNWLDILNILGNDPVWRRKINDQLFGRYLLKLKMSDFEKLPEFIKASLIQEFDKLPVDEENFNSELDGLIRGIITRNRDTYAPIEEYEDIINTPSWKVAARYLFGNNPEKYAEGGKFNVIPEGALHARLHHMDNDENITKKGIPVVSEKENGEIEQLAEIERNEVILRLEVTKKLEELLKKYYSDEYTQKEKDEFAIEAGKLLTYELLENTVDNTGLLNTI